MTENTYLDPNEIYGSTQESWRDLWDEELTSYENLMSICGQAVILPYQSIQLPIAVTYLFASSKWAKVLPILFSYGRRGSSKSTFANLAARLHGQRQAFSPTDTFASLRNSLDLMRWIDPSDKRFEKDGAMLCWDNVRISTFLNDPKIYQMCLFGYDKNTDKIQIANNEGRNLTFTVFSPKIMSSIDPIHTYHEFTELHRRLLTIYHKPYQDFNLKEKEGSEIDINVERLNPDSINWDEFEEIFFNVWNSRENCIQYAHYRQQLTKRGKKLFKVPPIILAEQWTISIDLVCTGLIIGAWTTIQEGIDVFAKYWEFANSNNRVTQGSTYQLLEKFIDSEYGERIRAFKDASRQGIYIDKVRIPGIRVKQTLDAHHKQGELDIVPHMKNVIEIMNDLGWVLNTGNWEMK